MTARFRKATLALQATLLGFAGIADTPSQKVANLRVFDACSPACYGSNMGAWDTGPIDNDRAADWFGNLMSKTQLREEVVRGLSSGDPDVIRAAAWLIGLLGHVYVWPIDELDDDRALATRCLNALLNDEDWLGQWDDGDEIRARLRSEIAKVSD